MNNKIDFLRQAKSNVQVDTLINHFDSLYKSVMFVTSSFVPSTSSGSFVGGSFASYFTTPKKYITNHRFLL